MAEHRQADARRVFVSSLPAGVRDVRLARAVVVVSVVIFIVAVAFAKRPLGTVWPFIPIYQSALALNDLITAVLLFGQFRGSRSRALLVLAGGYLFTAAMAVVHMLTFPGLFAPRGLLGAGPQTTAWLFMFWHGGFPLCVIAYALVRTDAPAIPGPAERERTAIGMTAAAALVAAAAVTTLATAGQSVLPSIMRGNAYTAVMLGVVSTTWALSLVAVGILWQRRRPPSVLDVWLMVVMCAWTFDIALSAVFNAGRFDLGFYVGRIYGLLAASFVLIVLLLEHARLYAQLVAAHEQLEVQNRSLDETVKERTERLLQSEKVATMGSLLAGVAHELNNPLAVLVGEAQLLLEDQHNPELVERASNINQAAERCVRIVRNFLALARQHPPERTATPLGQVIQGAVELLAYELRSNGVAISVEVAPDVPVLWADAHQLHQVFVNLINNAHHAMRRQERPKRIAVTARLVADDRVRVEVRDTGPGIPPELQRRVFEAFFTTKPQGEGTGLGLSLCANIIREHGGRLALESTPGDGATFSIELPIVRPPTTGVADAVKAAPVPPQRILVVDDELGLARVLAQALARDGHVVDTANDGVTALERLGGSGYDVVISDTRMPVLDGEGFYAELEQRHPALCRRIIFLTGDVLSSDKRAFLERTGVPFVAKPCNVDDVRRALRDVVAPGPTTPSPPGAATPSPPGAATPSPPGAARPSPPRP